MSYFVVAGNAGLTEAVLDGSEQSTESYFS